MKYHCKKCGKAFYGSYYHAYREGNKFYCTWKCFNHRNDDKPKPKVILPKVGDTIKIVLVPGIQMYSNKVGVVKFYDSFGQLHGTWGGFVIIPGVDTYEIIKNATEVEE